MCGLAGIFDRRGKRLADQNVLDRMTDALSHRGPDGRGTLNEPGTALGHRRLSIIDVERASQPMASADERFEIVFNGEIYNYRELKSELERAGHRFRLDSDTEVLLEAYRAWGPDMLRRLRGMFAFALWDRKTDQLLLARDRFGVKPMVMADLPDGRLLFASELKALLEHPDLPRGIEPRAIEDYFAYGYVPEARSLLSAVTKLQPAHYALLDRSGGELVQTRYWDLAFSEDLDGEASRAGDLRQRLKDAVRSRLVADVEVAAFLSGGVDSSAVVALMASASEQRFKTLSIGFDSKAFDETEYARLVAERYDTEHHERIVTADDYGLVDRLADAFDEPFADASAIPTFRVCELARAHVKVALSGDGADEAFAGYRRYAMFQREETVRSLIPSAVRAVLFRPLGRAWPKLDRLPRPLRFKSTFEALGMDPAEAYFHAVSVTRSAERSALFSPQLKRELAGYDARELYMETFRNAPAETTLGKAQYTDIRHYLPGDILVKVDRMSMANSLEARDPLLDHELVEWAARLPARDRIRGGAGKWLMKEAVRPLLPDRLIDRPKMGFVVPIGEWLKGPLSAEVDRLCDASALSGSGYFDMEALKEMNLAHRAGKRDHSRTLWQALMLEKALAKLGAG
ncbi:asparagine synthetase B [Pacificimonas flava]|uniref:asparagine synthase (glutamine-hydrolyzing) n=2 Tax=Pacificimonas TaxID=1960290 RepID=A0A219B7Z8_9SPHN|nr:MULTISPECIES: XrtA/PEP-CTERM system amidotransferase [Pacificimonas]MBZ6379995.1 amidotransferase 1, exosortase A system-associated [Pacificimonas aurantium]OWV34512.1 asparagine synthetase B [Pacificimonas flava]